MMYLNFSLIVLILLNSVRSYKNNGVISAGFFLGLVFVIFSLPKYLYLHFFSKIVLTDITNISYIPIETTDHGMMYISSFLLVLLVFYNIIRMKKLENTIRKRIVIRNKGTLFIFYPLMIMLFVFSISYLDLLNSDNIIKKLNLSDESDNLDLTKYLVLKLAQLIKVIFYVFLVALVSGQRQKTFFKFAAITSLLLSTILSILVSQRSGIALLYFDLLVCLLVISKIRLRTLAYVIAVSIIINIVILTNRIDDLGINGFLESIFLRRYFFDVEKVSLIYEHSKWLCNETSSLFYFCTEKLTIDGNIHHYIGREVIGLSTVGVPPNIVGEIILRLGTLALYLVAPLLGIIIGVIEINIWKKASPLIKVSLIIILTRVLYFMSSSDMLGMLLRVTLDLTILYIGWFFYRMSGQVNYLKR